MFTKLTLQLRFMYRSDFLCFYHDRSHTLSLAPIYPIHPPLPTYPLLPPSTVPSPSIQSSFLSPHLLPSHSPPTTTTTSSFCSSLHPQSSSSSPAPNHLSPHNHHSFPHFTVHLDISKICYISRTH